MRLLILPVFLFSITSFSANFSVASEILLGCRLDFYLCRDSQCKSVQRNTVACEKRKVRTDEYVSFDIKGPIGPIKYYAEFSGANVFNSLMRINLENHPNVAVADKILPGHNMGVSLGLFSNNVKQYYNGALIDDIVFMCGVDPEIFQAGNCL